MSYQSSPVSDDKVQEKYVFQKNLKSMDNDNDLKSIDSQKVNNMQNSEFMRQISITDCDSPKRMSVRTNIDEYENDVTFNFFLKFSIKKI